MAKEIETHEYCIHEREFGEVTMLLAKISKEVLGNGELGLAKTVPRLEDKINDLAGSVIAHTQVISNFIEFQASHNGEEKGKKDAEIRQHVADELLKQTAKDTKNEQSRADELRRQKKRDGWQRWMWVIMALIAFLSIITGIYFGFRNLNKGQKEIKDEMKITNKVLVPPGNTRSIIIIPVNDTTKNIK